MTFLQLKSSIRKLIVCFSFWLPQKAKKKLKQTGYKDMFVWGVAFKKTDTGFCCRKIDLLKKLGGSLDAKSCRWKEFDTNLTVKELLSL
jgi:hypothetical protein